MSANERAAEAAMALVGVPFRLHGRDCRRGLDCVGVAVAALGGEARLGPVMTGYALRSGDGVGAQAALRRAGLEPVDVPRIGDVILAQAGPGQLHLAVLVTGGIVHADAVLRKVVFRPGGPPWPVASAWRFYNEEK
ncbi:peptidoglycan endopeptidase [Stakelama sp. CBK3Z-3]|uniref:Peptidoglycan endopeptidase n=1 Tax=Stakelama flava TaxID=2860338 RepID=A0ABS6XK40_9SPHN|nr:peptidoglycan endopeptidase [Stakelama flava]MBW4330573.1 peptidoglycan endopeptidase [Stakelama flava]